MVVVYSTVMSDETPPSGTELITFEFHRSNFYRVVHVDGVFGGVTPTGYILASFFSQSAATPDTSTHEINAGVLGTEVSRTGSRNIRRELEVGVVMDLTVAKSMLDWLREKIEVMEKKD